MMMIISFSFSSVFILFTRHSIWKEALDNTFQISFQMSLKIIQVLFLLPQDGIVSPIKSKPRQQDHSLIGYIPWISSPKITMKHVRRLSVFVEFVMFYHQMSTVAYIKSM